MSQNKRGICSLMSLNLLISLLFFFLPSFTCKYDKPPRDLVECTCKIENHAFDDMDMGSACVIAEENGKYLLITCNHVVNTSPAVVILKFPDRFIVAATLIAKDQKHDLAIYSIPSDHTLHPRGVAALPTKFDERCWQVGYPLGIGPNWRQGVLKGRGNLSDEKTKIVTRIDLYSFTAIEGDSGSAVYNHNGRVVGLVMARFKATGQAMCISLDEIKDFCRENCKKDFPKFVESLK